MACLILRFENDVLIIYRQKDNKYDGWVTEFLTNLKKEQEAKYQVNRERVRKWLVEQGKWQINPKVLNYLKNRMLKPVASGK